MHLNLNPLSVVSRGRKNVFSHARLNDTDTLVALLPPNGLSDEALNDLLSPIAMLVSLRVPEKCVRGPLNPRNCRCRRHAIYRACTSFSSGVPRGC